MTPSDALELIDGLETRFRRAGHLSAADELREARTALTDAGVAELTPEADALYVALRVRCYECAGPFLRDAGLAEVEAVGTYEELTAGLPPSELIEGDHPTLVYLYDRIGEGTLEIHRLAPRGDSNADLTRLVTRGIA